MKNVLKTAGIVLSVIAWSGGLARAQQSGQAGGGNLPIAVIDIPLIFKNHVRFKQQLDTVKAEIESFEKEVNEERRKFTTQRDRLQTYSPGSPEYKQLEEDLARQASDQQVRGTLKRKDVMEREAKIYFETYNEIVREVTKAAQQYGFVLVLRHDSEPIDMRDRNSILAGVSRPIVYQRGLDITQLVLSQLNQGMPSPSNNGNSNNNNGQALRPAAPGSTLRPR